MADRTTFTERVLASAARRANKAGDTLALLKRMAGGDIVLTESALNGVMRRAGLDEDLPIRWETLRVRLYSGYFEVDAQGAALRVAGPLFRIQGRFESVEVALDRQIIRIRLLRDIQGFSQGVVQRVLLILVRAIFGKLFEPEALIKLLDRGHVAFSQEEPNLLRVELHKMEHVQKHMDGLVSKAAAKVLGRDTVLVHGIDCNPGELVIRTTTVAQELSGRALKLGSIAGDAASRLIGHLGNVGRALVDDEDPGDDTPEMPPGF